MQESYQEKTEQPTDKRLEEARQKGQVAQSREMPTSFIILFSTIFLYFSITHGFHEMFRVYVSYTRNIDLDINTGNIYSIISFGMYRWLWIVVPLLAFLVAIVFFSTVLQTGFMWSSEALKFDVENINPASGLKKIFSKRSAVEVIKSLIKIFIMVYIVYTLIVKELPHIFSLTGQDTRSIVEYLGKASFGLTVKVGMIFLFIAGIDLLYQKWQHRKDLMMTAQEVKEEHKEHEGNPLVKSRIRSLQREMSRRRMIEDVKTADVVVTNPTTYAIALKYVAGEMLAPKVVGKGAGFVAARIKEVAMRYRVPLVENKPLAQGLFFAVKVGDFIPEKFYLIVAELLAEVYRKRRGVSL
ncbi:MAG: Flagellar biosynthetic protein FlhB [Syntrophorhabdus sp. PtaU1.Bin058]|nr:MAG: Flagellar biosynthetic protein FlhB [Syntrophorhabdus sp. PtaU1.Bin058]